MLYTDKYLLPTFSVMIHIIDDDPHILSMLGEIMEMRGRPVASFSCSSSYCEYASSSSYNPPNIIITDVKMPKVSGYQLMKNVSDIHKGIKFIVMTGYQEAQDKPCQHPHVFIRKPFNPAKLDMHIQLLMNET